MNDAISTADMPLVRGHLQRLSDFTGRENRKPFWLWYLVVYAALYLVQTVVMVPGMVLFMGRVAPAMQAAGATDPYTGKPLPPDPSVVFGAMAPMFYLIFGIVLVVLVVQFVLVSAAAVRRLHDRAWSGWWLAPFIALQLGVIGAMTLLFPSFFAHLPPPGSSQGPPAGFMALILVMMLLAFVQLAYMIFLVVRLCLPGTVGPNRYGPDPLEGQHAPPAGWPAAPRTAATVVGTSTAPPPTPL